MSVYVRIQIHFCINTGDPLFRNAARVFFFKRAANSVGKIRRLNNKGKGKKIKNERRRAKGKGLLERERGDGNLSSPVMNKSPVDSLCARKLATRALLKWQQRRFLFIFGYIRRPWYVYNDWIDGERETRLSPCRHPHHSRAPSLGLLCKRQDGVTFPYFCFFLSTKGRRRSKGKIVIASDRLMCFLPSLPHHHLPYSTAHSSSYMPDPAQL